MASLGIVSAITPIDVAMVPHRIASGVSSGVRASICFPVP